MKQDTLIEHKEAIVVCDYESGPIDLSYNVLATNHIKS
jgi:hypothetical protein